SISRYLAEVPFSIACRSTGSARGRKRGRGVSRGLAGFSLASGYRHNPNSVRRQRSSVEGLMVPIFHHRTVEQARNAAIAWLEERGVEFGPHRTIPIGRLGVLAGSETGVASSRKPFWRLRLDYDPAKGPHYNAEFGEGTSRQKAAFAFTGSEA